MARPEPRTLTLISRTRLTPNMVRLRLGGPGMAGFPDGFAGGYVKLRLGDGGGGAKPIVRTYTIRHQTAEGIDLDFAVHGSDSETPGPAVDWALTALFGDTIVVGGPGPAKPLPPGMDRYLVAGDMTALPAISVNLEALDPEARGAAVIEIQHEDDRQELAVPSGFAVHWLVNPHPGSDPELLLRSLRELGWEDGDTYGWVAAEFEAMKLLRDYLRTERGLGRDRLYASSYWKQGEDEDSHRVFKRADAEAA